MRKQLTNLVMKSAAPVLVLSVAACLAMGWHTHVAEVRSNGEQLPVVNPVTMCRATVPGPDLWAVLAPGGMVARMRSESPLRERYRLAGTFEVFGGGGAVRVGRAIIDDLDTGFQFLVSEGETVSDLRVLHIFSDRVRVAYQGREEVLPLGFSDPVGAVEQSEPERLAEPESEQNAFGRRVGENRWIIQKDALLEYYDRLKDNPERLVSLYEAFRPRYDEDGNSIKGYTLDVQLEPELLEAAGLQQNDVVRSVNSMDMSSRQRGEYFVSEFLQGRLSAVVLDVERNGEAKRLIYMIR